MTRSSPGQAGRQGPPVGAISPSDHRGRDRGYRGGIPNLFQEACKNCSTKKLEHIEAALEFGTAKELGHAAYRGEREGDDSVQIGKFDIRRECPDCAMDSGCLLRSLLQQGTVDGLQRRRKQGGKGL